MSDGPPSARMRSTPCSLRRVSMALWMSTLPCESDGDLIASLVSRPELSIFASSLITRIVLSRSGLIMFPSSGAVALQSIMWRGCSGSPREARIWARSSGMWSEIFSARKVPAPIIMASARDLRMRMRRRSDSPPIEPALPPMAAFPSRVETMFMRTLGRREVSRDRSQRSSYMRSSGTATEGVG